MKKNCLKFRRKFVCVNTFLAYNYRFMSILCFSFGTVEVRGDQKFVCLLLFTPDCLLIGQDWV